MIVITDMVTSCYRNRLMSVYSGVYTPTALQRRYFQLEDGANVYSNEPLFSLLYGAFIPSPCLGDVYFLGIVERN